MRKYLLIFASFAVLCACEKEGKQAAVVTGISINKKTLLLTTVESEGVKVLLEPEGATEKVTWVSSDEEVATVSESVVMSSEASIRAIGPGHAVITAYAGDQKAECEVSVVAVPEGAVDLGVTITREDGSKYRLFWAKSNLCESGLCSSPEDYGDYYSWGELTPNYTSLDPLTWREGKTGYNWSSYKWGDGNRVTRYCPSDKPKGWGGPGDPDNKTEFKDYDYADDAARATLGGNWRIPTYSEWWALVRQCTVNVVYSLKDAVASVVVYKGKVEFSATSIHLPFAGYMTYDGLREAEIGCYYWSSSLDSEFGVSPLGAGMFYRYRGGDSHEINIARYNGFSVRPVTEGITEKPCS